MSAFNIWRENPPPRDTDVLVKYELLDKDWQPAHTCKQGCCISMGYGPMLLPKFWKEVEQKK